MTTEGAAKYKEGQSFAADIEHAARGEAIEVVVIGTGWSYVDDGHDESVFPKGVPPLKKVLTWEEARPFLDYEYDPGYGGVNCAPVWAYTATRVLFVGCYDGSTWVQSIPRNPEEGNPDSVGGG